MPKLTKKRLVRSVWKLADKMGIDEFDALVSPLIAEVCSQRGWDYDSILKQYTPDMRKEDADERTRDS